MELEINVEKEIKNIPNELLDIILSGMGESKSEENRTAIVNGTIEAMKEDGTIKGLLVEAINTRLLQCAAEYNIEATEAVVGS